MNETIFSVIIGGLISAITSVICNWWQNKKTVELEREKEKIENKRWLRERKEDLYVTLSGVLQKINIPVGPDGLAPKDDIRKHIDDIADWIETNKGLLALFVPGEIHGEIIKFRGELYQLWSNDELRHIDFYKVDESFIIHCVEHAKMIQSLMQKDLGIN